MSNHQVLPPGDSPGIGPRIGHQGWQMGWARNSWTSNAIEAVRTAWAMRSRQWWTRKPRVPVPDRDYLRWRSLTAYGDADAAIVAADLKSFLVWRSGFRRYVRRMR
jgi:hypothetical protein